MGLKGARSGEVSWDRTSPARYASLPADLPTHLRRAPHLGASMNEYLNAAAPAAFPAFPEAIRAQAIFLEEVQLAVHGRKSPKDAVAAITERVTLLLPA